MKNYRSKTIFLLIGFLTMWACSDLLDLNPRDSLSTETAFNRIEDYENAVLGGYEAMRSSSYYGGFMQLIPDVLTDNLILCKDGRTSYNAFYNWDYTSGTFGIEGLWLVGYNAINRVNNVIVRLEGDENPFKGTDDEEKSLALLGEALAVRALIHFDLVRFFGIGYNFASADSPGIPVMTAPVVGSPERDNITRVYNQITQDLERARTLLRDVNHPNWRIGPLVVAGLQSRVYLTMNQYDRVVAAASQTIAGDGSDLSTINSFRDIWRQNTNREIMFRLRILNTDPQILGNVYGQGQFTGGSGHRAEYVPSFSFYSLYLDNDIRKQTYFITADYQSRRYNFIQKYSGRTGAPANKTDAIIMRRAEIYLNLAEAYFFQNEHQTALSLLNALRRARYEGFTDRQESGSALLAAILLERRLELAFEGFRFFDAKRLGLPIIRDSFGDESNGGGLPPSFTLLLPDDYRFQLPIPQAEILANPNMVQNPEYGD
jgi:starch-binding outer membrane protein, SusD/RagB family